MNQDCAGLFSGIDSSALLRLLDRYHEGLMITDASGAVVYMNEAQARIDDLAADHVIGKTVTELYRVDEGSSPTMACLKTGRAVRNFACYYRTHLGRIVNSIHNVYPIHDGNRLVGTICCISDYKNIEQIFAAVGKAERCLPRGSRRPARRGPDTARRQNGTCYTFDHIIGANLDFLAAVTSARLASQSPSPVMICGETGTGKELFAQAIHNSSRRRSMPYVAINCAAIPENLLEGMLFGTSKGAFTGAIDKAGLIESAHGGTLFLDEVNAMSPGLQAKLLRCLQERKVRRVGAVAEIEVDLKIISSVNTEPHLAIDAGALRADFYYRLAVVFLQIPALRCRRDDLAALTAHFVAKYNRLLDKQVAGPHRDVADLFERYDWPGNVRELEHVIEGAMNMMPSEKTIRAHHLCAPLGRQTLAGGGAWPVHASNRTPTGAGTAPTGQAGLTEPKSLADMQKEHEIASINAALARTGGNAARAARDLGISPQLLHYKLKRFGIDRTAHKSGG